MWADAWSTALMVLGPEAGLAFADREGVMALLRWRTTDGAWAEGASTNLRALET
jgi:thiamine biosynthesis lipoprotein